MVISSVTLAVLASALCHATWNALAHRLPDQQVAFCWIGVTYLLVCAPLTALLTTPAAAAWPFLAGSAAVHWAYNLLLMLSYRLGEFNQVYPLARGTSPLLVALAAVWVVGEPLTLARTAGVLVISAGLASLVLVGGAPTRGQLPAVLAALGTGLVIATYTVLDGVGVRRSGTALGYTGWLFVLQGPLVPVIALRRYGRRTWSLMRPHRTAGPVAGLLSITAYALVLWAQAHGALATVAALRESSVIVGAGIGALWFHERFGRGRVLATVLVAAGMVVLNLP